MSNYLTLGGFPVQKLSDKPVINKRIYSNRWYLLEDGRLFFCQGKYSDVFMYGEITDEPVPEGFDFDMETDITISRGMALRHELARVKMFAASYSTPCSE